MGEKKDNQATLGQEIDVLAKVELSYGSDRDLVNDLMGQQKMAEAISKMTAVAAILKVKKIKADKLYKALKGVELTDKFGEKWTHGGTFVDFCKSIGQSKTAVNEALENFETFGQEAYASIERVGLGRNNLRIIRKLPGDRIEAAKQLLEDGKKSELLELIEDQAVRHHDQKQAIQEELTEATATLEARQKTLDTKDKKINELDEKLNKREHQLEGWEAKVDDLNISITTSAGLASNALSNLDLMRERMMFLELNEDHRQAAEERLGTNYYAVMKSLLIRIDEMMNVCQAEFGHYEDRAMPLMDQWLEREENKNKELS